MECKNCNAPTETAVCKNCRLNNNYYIPKGKKINQCQRCTVYRPLDANSLCKQCGKDLDSKTCYECLEFKSTLEFYSKQSICKQCRKKKPTKKRNKLATESEIKKRIDTLLARELELKQKLIPQNMLKKAQAELKTSLIKEEIELQLRIQQLKQELKELADFAYEKYQKQSIDQRYELD
jgi:hypothetical protein